MNPAAHPINHNNTGILNLRRLVGEVRNIMPGPLIRECPIVLVPGFSGWGRPFLGTVNYFGGFEDLPLILSQQGYIVIVVRIGPISSNRERACEIFAQLTDPAGFVRPGNPGVLIPVNYGTKLPIPTTTARTVQAVLYDTPKNRLRANWRWGGMSCGRRNRVNFICHSQGGTTVRYLIQLLSGAGPREIPQFLGVSIQPWVNAVVTIGTPHKGTTVTEIVRDILPDNRLEPLIDFITSCSFEPRQARIYDLQLDHWGFFRNPGETYQMMRARIAPDVVTWWTHRVNGLYDNSLAGVRDLDDVAPTPSPHSYYFTMSFCATTPFPNEFLTAGNVNGWLALFPLDKVWKFFGITGQLFALIQPPLTAIGFLPPLRAVLSWITSVANEHLGNLGYFSQVPQPGSQVPRTDMLPLIMYPAYAMGGRLIPPEHALPGISSEEFQLNDGIVNTRSMDGPKNGPMGNGDFARALATLGVDARGRYWHLGRNETIDHADQIGVFTDVNTNMEVQEMYIMFAELVDRLC